MRTKLSSLFSLLVILALSLTAGGCEDRPLDHPAQAPSPTSADGVAGDFEEVERTVRGSLDEGRTHTHGLVLVGTYCYRFFAQGSAGLEDLDISLVGPDGVPMQRDHEQGPVATLGLRDAICPYLSTEHRISVRATKGAGDYVVRIFRKQAL